MNAVEMIQKCGERQSAMAEEYVAPHTLQGQEMPDRGEYVQASDTSREDAIRTTYVMGCEDVG